MRILTIPDMTPRKNLIINGDFRVNQRGSNISWDFGAKYVSDRWQAQASSGSITANTYVVGELYVANTSATTAQCVYQDIDDISGLGSETFTLSFECDNSSSQDSTSYITLAWIDSGGTPQGSESSSLGIVKDGKVTFTARMNSIGTGVKLRVTIYPTGNQSAYWALKLSKVKLEVGAYATEFVADDHAVSLSKCKLFFERLNNNAYATIGSGGFSTTGTLCTTLHFQEKRAVPTISYSAGTDYSVYSRGALIGVGGLSFTYTSRKAVICNSSIASSPRVVDQQGSLIGETIGYIDIDAEI